MKNESIKGLFNNLIGKRLEKLEKNSEYVLNSLEGFKKNINILKSKIS
jgi:hypothetical protein